MKSAISTNSLSGPVNGNMPVMGPDKVDHRPDSGQIGISAKVSHEAEPDAAEPCRIEAADFLRAGSRLNQRHAAIPSSSRGQRVTHRSMIEAMSLALDDDRTIEPEMIMQPAQVGFRRFVGRETAVLGQRELGERTVNMTVGITAPRWKSD